MERVYKYEMWTQRNRFSLEPYKGNSLLYSVHTEYFTPLTQNRNFSTPSNFVTPAGHTSVPQV